MNVNEEMIERLIEQTLAKIKKDDEEIFKSVTEQHGRLADEKLEWYYEPSKENVRVCYPNTGYDGDDKTAFFVGQTNNGKIQFIDLEH